MSDQFSQQAYEPLPDDETVEIVPLDQSNSSGSPVLPSLKEAHLQHISRRTLTLRLTVFLSFLLLIVLVVPDSVVNVRNVVSGAVQNWFFHSGSTSTARTNSYPIEGGYYIDVSLPWTQVTIDGIPVQIPTLNRDIPLALGAERHFITWTAVPFVTQYCVLSTPAALVDACPIAPDAPLQQVQDTPTQIILLRDGLSELPHKAQAALIQTTQAAFTNIQDSQIVQPGELYIGPLGYTRATQRLHATLHFRFDVHATGYMLYEIAGQLCEQLCVVPGRYLQPQITVPSTGVAWLALCYISSYWTYTTDDGRVVAQSQSAVPGGVGMDAYPVLLRVLWNGTNWQVTPLIGANQAPPIAVSSLVPHRPPTPADKVRLFDNPACVNARFLYSAVGMSYANTHFISSIHPAQGCLVIVSSSSGQPDAIYFEHLGLLLAANDIAHAAQPQLPLADAYERGLVGNWPRFHRQSLPSV